VVFDARWGIGAGPNGKDVFAFNRVTKTLTVVSLNTAGVIGNGFVWPGVGVSSNGRYVAFASDASDLVAGDTNSATDTFVRDLINKKTYRVSTNGVLQQSTFFSSVPAISSDGNFVAFQSPDNTLVSNDGDNLYDVFERRTVPMGVSSVAPNAFPAGASTPVTVHGSGFQPATTVSFTGAHATAVTITGVTYVNPSTLTANVSVAGGTPAGSLTVVATETGAWATTPLAIGRCSCAHTS
jgi:hypothetical protein